MANDFEQLERMSREYRADKSRTASGLWNLSLFYAGIDETIQNHTQGEDRDTLFEAIEERTRKWAKAPTSAAARCTQTLRPRA